jgi:hypothetical protein
VALTILWTASRPQAQVLRTITANTPGQAATVLSMCGNENNNELANLSIEIRDFQFSNGVVGQLVSYNITER